MAGKVTEVFRVTVPSVGLVLKVRGDVDGKQDAYSRRIKDDNRCDGGEDALFAVVAAVGWIPDDGAVSQNVQFDDSHLRT